MRENQARFFSKVGGLITGGVPWLEAFTVAARGVRGDPDLAAALLRVVDRMRGGAAPSDALARESAFSEEVVRTIRAGEEMGDLERKAEQIAEALLGGSFEAGRPAEVSEEGRAALEALVARARGDGASHLHLEPTPDGGRILARIAGRLVEREYPEPDRYRLLLEGLDSRSRRVAYREGPGAVVDLRPPLDLASVEVLDEVRARLEPLVEDREGLVLVAGLTAIGRESVVEALLAALGEPVKVCVVGATGTKARAGRLHLRPGDKASGSANALREALGQDPDAVVLAAPPDDAAADLATRAAGRGALVLIHVDAVRAEAAVADWIARIEPDLLGEATVDAVAVRLVRRLCPLCRRPAEPDPETLERLGLPAEGPYVEPVGCEWCDAGYGDPIAVVELAGSAAEPSRSVREAALVLAVAGETSIEEALASTPP